MKAVTFGITFFIVTFFCVNAFSQKKQNVKMGYIDYNSIPRFKLSPYFILVYGGPIFNNDVSGPLNHGMTHIDIKGQMQLYDRLSKKQRAYGVYNLYNINPAFMKETGKYFSPDWSHSIQNYPDCFKEKDRELIVFNPWNNRLKESYFKYYDWLAKREGFKNKEFDYIWFDYEASNGGEDGISKLQCPSILKKENSYLLRLSKNEFINAYFEEMSKVYDSTFTYITDNLFSPNYSFRTIYSENAVKSYPITKNVFSLSNKQRFFGISSSEVNKMIVQPNKSVFRGSSLYLHSSIISPFLYAPVNYPYYPLTDYVLSLINLYEMNQELSDKPVVPFVWLRRNHPVDECKSGPPVNALPVIERYESAALGPMSLMSGMKGLHLWDYYNEIFCNKKWIDHSIYEYFIRGLQKLSKYNDFFDGKQYYFRQSTAFEDIIQKKPIWRGVCNNGKILIAGYNPWAASDSEIYAFNIILNGTKVSLKTKGREVAFLVDNMNLQQLKRDPGLTGFSAR
jgi:hypothetical protein